MAESERPRHLSELRERPEEPELRDLWELRAAGIPVAPICVVPAAAEESFYRLNNLPAQLSDLFRAVDQADPDEDDLEELCPAAERLIAEHYLLDEFVDQFYGATADLPARVCVRRPGEDGKTTARGRPSLLALKETWRKDWSVDSLLQRLQATSRLALEARPVLIHAAGRPADPALHQRVVESLGREVFVHAAEHGVTQVG